MWARCTDGHQHWGPDGAAGLLVVDAGEVLLQRRSRLVHHGGTWSVPGGAVERGETTWEAALREAEEECGISAAGLLPRLEHVADCGGWTYSTWVAGTASRDVTRRHNLESDGHAWVALDAVADLRLHPGFARSWPDIASLLA